VLQLIWTGFWHRDVCRYPRSYLDECQYLGFFHGWIRWRSHDGQRLYEWDDLHGESEVYSRWGKYLGVLDPVGKMIAVAVSVRTSDV
jgi:hypothetical protein